jgi:hypothetical protein
VLLLVSALTGIGCEEESSALVTDIGTVGFVLTDPELSPQIVSIGLEPEYTLQSMIWRLTSPAELTRADGASVDLTFGADCLMVQTIDSTYNPEGPCSRGIILGSTDDFGAVPPQDVPVNLVMRVAELTVWRAEPLVLLPTGDYDADQVNNATDNCPLFPNEDQKDLNEDGIGDACAVTDFFGNVVPDNDGDGVADANDNCVWFQNPLQEDTTGVSAIYGIPDGIGDACTEQYINTYAEIPADIGRNFDLALATGGLSFVTVDFDNTVTLDNFDWIGHSASFVESGVQACGRESSISLALEGCD